MEQVNLIELTSLQLTETHNFQPILTTKWLFITSTNYTGTVYISRIPLQELALSQIILLLIMLCRCVCHHCSNNCLFEPKWPKLSLHVINQVIDWSQRSMLLYIHLVCTSVLLLKIINYSSSCCPLGCILRCFYYFVLISIVFSWQWGQARSS